MADFEPAIIKTLANEGGARYTETPGDTGGATKFGISKRAYPQLDIAQITEEQAREIYRHDYWNVVRGDEIKSQLVAENLFDTGVNMGNGRAIKLAQMALGLKPIDGRATPEFIAALNAVEPSRFIADFTLAKVARYVGLCNSNRSQSKFLLGWLNRALGGLA